MLEGVIVEENKGKDGFGYDAIFMPNHYGLTYAQMDAKQKNGISHRSKALEKIKREISTIF